MTTATMTAETNGTAALPKTKRARKPAEPKTPKQATAQQLLEQLAALKQQQARDGIALALKAAAELHDTLTMLAGEAECPLPRDSVQAVLFVLGAAEAQWRKATWTPKAE